jgi:hypothetical protein
VKEDGEVYSIDEVIDKCQKKWSSISDEQKESLMDLYNKAVFENDLHNKFVKQLEDNHVFA